MSPATTAPLRYPTGWFCVGRTRDLLPGQVRTARLAGEDVVLYRTRRGTRTGGRRALPAPVTCGCG